MPALSCLDVAYYFLSLADEDEGDFISNLKLQKLLYYAQGFHLAIYNEPLFPEAVEAWTHGPVVPEAYHHFKEYGNQPIPRPENLDLDRYDERTRTFLDEVYQVYGQFSALRLREMTHAEPPWQTTQNGDVIPNDVLAEFFKTRLVW